MTNVDNIKNFELRQIIDRLQKRNVSCQFVPDSEVIEINHQKQKVYITDHESPFIPLGYRSVIDHKYALKMFLKDKNVPCFEGKIYHINQKLEAFEYADNILGWPITIKPADLSCGDLVFCAVKDKETFFEIWQEHIEKQSQSQWFVVEQCWPSVPDFRLVKFKDEPLRVAKKSVPTITGDGTSTIKELVDIENNRRVSGQRNCLCDIYLEDEDGMRCLSDQKLTFYSVPLKGQVVQLRYTTNLSYGGMAEILPSDIVHNDYKVLLDYLWSFFPKLPFITLDVFSRDISAEITKDNMRVNESHITPGFGMFLSPEKGESFDYYDKLAGIILNNMELEYV